jgi:hypothetical protein
MEKVVSTEEEYTAERLDGKGEVKGKFYEDQKFIDGESCVDVSIIVTEDFEMIRIKPETLRQTGGKLFDRVKELEEGSKYAELERDELLMWVATLNKAISMVDIKGGLISRVRWLMRSSQK